MPESLIRQIRQAQGDILKIGQNLGQLARQFGDATGMHGALRRFVGEDESAPTPLTEDMTEPHMRGAILVSAVFAAFLTIYKSRCADLIRLATNGSGVLPAGDISVDLANRLASEASKTATHVLNMCIRALDYCPPVNLEFGDFLRAIITADRDLVRDDDRGYRVAFIDAFRQRDIFPYDLRRLAEDSLLWEPPPMEQDLLNLFSEIVPKLNLNWGMTTERKSAFDMSQKNGAILQKWLTGRGGGKRPLPLLRQVLGFEEPAKRRTVELEGDTYTGEIRPIETHSVRVCRRTAPDGSSKPTLVIELTQTFRAEPSQDRHRGGCTLLFDLNDSPPSLKYLVRKRLLSPWSFKNQTDLQFGAMRMAAERGQVFFAPGDPAGRGKAFAMMHRYEDEQ
jgi:hypothetical protein